MSDPLRKAAEMALEALNETADKIYSQDDDDSIGIARKALRQALAQPEQEPVAWVTFNAYGEEDDVWYENPEGKLLDGWTYKPLYTAPPKREWVGLTDEEIWETEPYKMAVTDQETRWLYRFAKTIEAKLKEKNT